MTLVEVLLAMTILSVVVLGISYAATAAHQHLHHGESVLRALQLGEHLMEEILSRPYSGSGEQRSEFHLDDYDGFLENAGELTDFAGNLYSGGEQMFSRSASVTAASHSVPGLADVTIAGKTVVITVQSAKGIQWQLTRFIPEPVAP